MLASHIEDCSILYWYSTSTYNYPVVTRDYIFVGSLLSMESAGAPSAYRDLKLVAFTVCNIS